MTSLRRSNHGRNRRRRSRGQALVEFALVIPLFLLLLAGMIDFGIGLYSYMSVQNAARDGARLGATNCSAGPCTDPVTARVVNVSGGLLTNSNVTVLCQDAANATVQCRPTTATSAGGVQKGDSVTVTVNYTYKMIWPLTFGTQIPMKAAVTFMVE